MEFLDKLVIPQSAEHLHLLHYLLMIVLFFFIPFIAVVIGGTSLSVYFKSKASSQKHLKFSKDVIDIVTINKSVGIILGIISLLTSIVILIQLLHTMQIGTINYLTACFVIIVVGLVLVYTYKYTLSFSNIFNSFRDVDIPDKSIKNEVEKFKEGSSSLSSKTGKAGVVFLLVGMWIFFAAISLIVFSQSWGERDFFYVLFSWEVLSQFVQFIAAAFALTGGTILFAFFYWEGGRQITDEDYKNFVRKVGVRIVFAGVIIQPLFLMINLFALPTAALSTAVFGFAVIALLLLFWVYHLLYYMQKFSSVKFSGMLFFVILFSFIALIVKDELTISNSTELQTAELSNKYDEFLADLRAKNAPPVKINGEEIYKNICSSCHSFDHKVVGPPYEETMPKYEGKMNSLVAFILNPTQNNPGYPPMPNPGLKPNQAKAVAEYIMKTYEEKYKKK